MTSHLSYDSWNCRERTVGLNYTEGQGKFWTHVHTFLLENDLPFDILVVGGWRLRLIVKEEQELVRNLLLDFHGFVVANEVEGRYLVNPISKPST